MTDNLVFTPIHTPQSLNAWLGYLFPPEMDELTRLCHTLPNNPRVVNIGAGGGVSGAVFMASRPDLYLYTIDKTAESHPFGSLASEQKALEDCGLLDWTRHEQIHGDSVHVGLMWDKGKVDMVFIDGDHSYHGCKGDIEAWRSHLKPGGYLSIHDYRKQDVVGRNSEPVNGQPHPKPWPGVDKAVKDTLLSSKAFELVGIVASLITFRVK